MTTNTLRWCVAFATLVLTGCPFDTAPELSTDTASESSSEDESSDDGESSSDGGSEASEAGSEETSDAESGDESESDGGSSSSTGAELTTHALHFDGTSYARKGEEGGTYDWSDAEFTVDAWIEIEDETATGVIFDAQNGVDTGFAMYIQPEWHKLVFSLWDDANVNVVIEGPTVSQMGAGWHHVAASKVGNVAYLHVDGVAVAATEVGWDIAYGPVVLSVGAVSTNEPFWDLQAVNIDEIRLASYPIYVDNFDPPMALDVDVEGIIFALRMEEGDGVVARDSSDAGLDFLVTNPQWVAGR